MVKLKLQGTISLLKTKLQQFSQAKRPGKGPIKNL